MGLLGGGAQEALGLHIDGQHVQVAHLRREGKGIVLAGLDSATLVGRFDLQEEGGEGSASEPVETGDILGLAEEPAAEAEEPLLQEEEERAPETNSEVLLNLLSRFPVNRCRLAVSLMDTNVLFSDFGELSDAKGRQLKGKGLKRRLMEEAEKERTFAGALPLEERHAFFEYGEGRLLSIVHEDPLEILNPLDELRPFIGRVQVRLIEPIEIALMNLVRLSYPPEEHVTAVVFMGEDFSRVIFMRNGDYLTFSQPIHEGLGSPQSRHTIYSRILFEQDVSDLPEIGRVILTGGCRTAEAQPFFAEQFPDARVDYLALPELDLSKADEQDGDLISSFAVPVGLAWKALCPKESRFYPPNFLPRVRRKQQNPVELAWHGLALIILLVVGGFLLGLKAREQSWAIDALNLSIEVLEQQIQENSSYVKLVDDLYAQIADYERNFALVDTLSWQRVLWSSRLREVDDAVQSTGGIWLERFSTAEGGVDIASDWSTGELPLPTEIFIQGKALRRDRIPEISERLGDGLIRSIVRSKIRGRTVYEFDMRMPIASSTVRP